MGSCVCAYMGAGVGGYVCLYLYICIWVNRRGGDAWWLSEQLRALGLSRLAGGRPHRFGATGGMCIYKFKDIETDINTYR